MSPLDRSRADRAGVASELDRLHAVSAKLRGAANAEAAVIRDIGELGTTEISEITAWASAGGVGDAPSPDVKRRRALAEKLAAASAAATAARGAGQGIDDQIREQQSLLSEMDRQFERSVLDAMQAEHRIMLDEYADAVHRLRAVAAKVHGLANYLTETGRALTDRGDADNGRHYFARATALNETKLPQIGVTQHEVMAAAAVWSQRANALRSGSETP